MNMFSSPTCRRISMLAPSSVPIVSAPLSASFMLPVPEASMPAGRDLLGEVGRRDDRFGEAHVVVRNENHLEPAAHGGIAVDHARDVRGELDDELRLVVARRPPCRAKIFTRGTHARVRLRPHRVVERDRLEDVEELPLVLVDALDVDVEQRTSGSRPKPRRSATMRARRDLVVAAHGGEALAKRRVVGERLERHEAASASSSTSGPIASTMSLVSPGFA